MLTPYRLLVLLAASVLTGCAAAAPGFSPSDTRADKLHTVPAGGGMTPEGRYVLNDQESKLDCRRLSGSIHVGILQLREQAARHRPSPVAAQMQKMSTPVTGGSAYGMDPDGEAARTRARLEAFNARLAEKNCPTYDLAAELKPGNTAQPTPVRAKKR
ncbi:MAG: hypothetical protein HC869_25020 [Rhodospirillales bacterium]|nr:hypothetical protein [Rhodospirillales bacterium]